jgi:hypothetical protein
VVPEAVMKEMEHRLYATLESIEDEGFDEVRLVT